MSTGFRKPPDCHCVAFRPGEAAHHMTDWSRFPVERIGPATFVKRALIHASLLYGVVARAKDGRPALEIGVGSGAQSGLLSRWRERVVTVDNDARIIEIARHNLDRFGREVSVVRADAFRLPFYTGSFSVAYSQGLMEHFGDESIGALLREQLRVADSVVFSVPSSAYPRQDVGDERLMSAGEWENLVGSALAGTGYRMRAKGYAFDPEAWKHSLRRRRWDGSYSVLVTIDPPR